jgi:hypothetical protein
VARELERLAPPVRQLAWAKPRRGHAEEGARALQATAAQLTSI